MNRLALPQAGDWNHFWEANTNKRLGHVSWSKKRILNVIQPFVVRGKSALDAGCGSGFFSKYFCDEGMDTTSLDYSQQALLMTKDITAARSNIIQADLLNPEIVNEIPQKFNFIFSDGLFEHFSDDDQNIIMLNFKRLLNKDGVIVVIVPNKYSPWELIRPIFMPGIKEEPFTMNQLLNLNKRNGLVVLNNGGINVIPVVLSPDKLLGRYFGMLLFTIAKVHDPT